MPSPSSSVAVAAAPPGSGALSEPMPPLFFSLSGSAVADVAGKTAAEAFVDAERFVRNIAGPGLPGDSLKVTLASPLFWVIHMKCAHEGSAAQMRRAARIAMLCPPR